MNKILPIILVIFFSNHANAYDEERARMNYVDDLLTCSVYYHISINDEVGKANQNNPQVIKIRKLQSDLWDLALVYAKSIDITITAFTVKFWNINDEMGSEMNGNYKNYAVLIRKYNNFCEQLVANPDDRLEYWRKK